MRTLIIPRDLETPWTETHLRVAARDGLLYCGWRDTNGEPQVYRVEHHGDSQPLTATPLEHRVVHSPTGFAWGYAGSGPADLAYALLRDYLRWRLAGRRRWADLAEHVASELHQDIKRDLVAALPERWIMPERALRASLMAILKQARRSKGWLSPTTAAALELALHGQKESGPLEAAR